MLEKLTKHLLKHSQFLLNMNMKWRYEDIDECFNGIIRALLNLLLTSLNLWLDFIGVKS